MNQHDDFRNRLIAAQQLTPEYRERYERRLESMITQQLTPVQRAVLAFSVLLGFGAVVWVGWVLATDTHTSIGLKYAIGFMGLVVLAITIIRAMNLVSGTTNARLHPKIVTYLAYFGVLIFVVVVMNLSSRGGAIGATYFTTVCLVPLVIVTGALTLMQVRQSELTVREKLLEIELRLAEMSEKLDTSQGP